MGALFQNVHLGARGNLGRGTRRVKMGAWDAGRDQFLSAKQSAWGTNSTATGVRVLEMAMGVHRDEQSWKKRSWSWGWLECMGGLVEVCGVAAFCNACAAHCRGFMNLVGAEQPGGCGVPNILQGDSSTRDGLGGASG